MAAIGMAIFGLCSLLAFVAYLGFCRFLVKHTNDPKSLSYAAELARAFLGRHTPEASTPADNTAPVEILNPRPPEVPGRDPGPGPELYPGSWSGTLN